MGIMDILKGKKNGGEDIVLEPSDGGYALKGARGSRVTGLFVFFDLTAPPGNERELLEGIIGEFSLAKEARPDAPISVNYGAIPGIDEYIAKGEIPESLNAFIMARAMMAGLARSQAEMGKLAVNPFNVKGVKGVLIEKEA